MTDWLSSNHGDQISNDPCRKFSDEVENIDPGSHFSCRFLVVVFEGKSLIHLFHQYTLPWMVKYLYYGQGYLK